MVIYGNLAGRTLLVIPLGVKKKYYIIFLQGLLVVGFFFFHGIKDD